MPISIDVYLALEYADGGDFYHLRGQLSEKEVINLMWQLLSAVEYIHSQNVWHRDLKSANVLLTMENGTRVVKVWLRWKVATAIAKLLLRHILMIPSRIELSVLSCVSLGFYSRKIYVQLHLVMCSVGKHLVHLLAQVADFGSARSACSFNDDALVETVLRSNHEIPRQDGNQGLPLTRQVCTPCYRAPEVVMSRGGYTSSLDTWSVGCIFAELLQRIAYVGSASTPQLQVALFILTALFPQNISRQPMQARKNKYEDTDHLERHWLDLYTAQLLLANGPFLCRFVA